MPAYDRDDALPIGSLGGTPLAVVTNAHRFFEIPIDDIAIPEGMRALDEAAVEQIVQSIKAIGFQAQGVICAQWSSPGEQPRATLVAGRHRLEALRRLGWPKVPVAIFDGDAAAARLWRLAENLARSDLSALERAAQLTEYVALQKLSKMDRFWADGGTQAALAPLLASSAHRGRKSIGRRKSLGWRLRPRPPQFISVWQTTHPLSLKLPASRAPKRKSRRCKVLPQGNRGGRSRHGPDHIKTLQTGCVT